MMYHQIKYGRKRINNSGDMVEMVVFYYINPECDLGFEDNTAMFLTEIWLTIYITIPNLLLKGSTIQKISSGIPLTEIVNFHCDLVIKHSNPVFSQDTLTYDDVPT